MPMALFVATVSYPDGPIYMPCQKHLNAANRMRYHTYHQGCAQESLCGCDCHLNDAASTLLCEEREETNHKEEWGHLQLKISVSWSGWMPCPSFPLPRLPPPTTRSKRQSRLIISSCSMLHAVITYQFCCSAVDSKRWKAPIRTWQHHQGASYSRRRALWKSQEALRLVASQLQSRLL